MSNKFISSSLANSQQSLVLSFDLDDNTKEYSIGISSHKNTNQSINELQISKSKLLWYSPTLINFNKIDNSINPTSFTFQNGFYYVWNTQNKLLGSDIIILQDVIPVQKEQFYTISNNGELIFYHKSNMDEPISNSAMNLNYTCYINTNNYSSTDEAIFHKDQYYYKTSFQVIPQLASDQDYDAIIVSNNNETVLLASDFIIKVDPTEHNISSIVAKHNGNVQSTDYIKFAEYDRARFVISDYGRMISHSIHKKNSDAMYQQVRVTVFDGDKFNSPIIQNDNYKYVYVNFSVNDKNSISNLTANF